MKNYLYSNIPEVSRPNNKYEIFDIVYSIDGDYINMFLCNI